MSESEEYTPSVDIPDIAVDNSEVKKMPTCQNVSKRSIITLLVLVYINLLNYMDRLTISSVLPEVQAWFNIGNEKAGLLQTIFVCAYMVFAPIFGYLGDRFSRKYVMAGGITIWTVTTFSGSLMGRDHFWGFFLLRGLVGIGEASYSTVAPTIIADLFVGDQRSKALSLFYLAIPCGSGLGYIVGSKVSAALGAWQWALRVTPALGIIAVILTLLAVHEPPRGVVEAVSGSDLVDDLSETIHPVHKSSYKEDLIKIFKVPSFVWSTAGFTCISFVVGALAWWAPEFTLYSQHVHDGNKNKTIDEVSLVFGIVTFISGVCGVWIGAELARRWRKHNMRADALVCALGILSSIPFLFFALHFADKYIILSWVLIAFGEVLMCLNWAPNGDLLLYVIPPSCRATAEAIQILIIHILGDAISPFIIGAISNAYNGNNKSEVTKQQGLLYGLYVTPFIACFGVLCYFNCARHLEQDKANAEAEGRKHLVIPSESTLNSLPTSHSPICDGPQKVIIPDMYGDTDQDIDEENGGDTTQLVPDVRFEQKNNKSLRD